MPDRHQMCTHAKRGWNVDDVTTLQPREPGSAGRPVSHTTSQPGNCSQKEVNVLHAFVQTSDTLLRDHVSQSTTQPTDHAAAVPRDDLLTLGVSCKAHGETTN